MTGVAYLLYGWHKYTDVWGQQRRTLAGWAHNPAKSLIRFPEDLNRFPDLEAVVVDVLSDVVLQAADPLDPVSTIKTAVYDFYNILDQGLSDHPNLHVIILISTRLFSLFLSIPI